MSRRRFEDMDCSVAQTLDVVGDWWTLLVVREATFGTRRFCDFERNLGIAKNILADRLRKLVDHEVLDREEAPDGRVTYRLTERGRDLSTVLVALREWGDKWVYGRGNEPIVLVERESGRRVKGLALLGADGQPIDGGRVVARPGRHAPDSVRRRFRRRVADSTRPV